MLSKSFSRRFASLGRGSANLSVTLQRLKEALRAPVKHLKRLNQSDAHHYAPMTNTTAEAFDEVSQEWQALLVGNPYDLQTYNFLEQVSSNNFGTVDNPHVVFTADAPFRFVVCCGPADVDDYEGHEALYFMLREGPMQRCQGCGQVFKLVRLRQELSSEMDYYQSNFLPYEVNEMGEQETHSTLSPLRYVTQYEPTHFEMPSNYVYTLVNNDDHDRMLVDPAYRLAKLKEIQEVTDIYSVQLQQMDKVHKASLSQEEQMLNKRVAMSKQDYVTMLEVERAINKLDRVFQKVDKFNNRQFTDPDNHERREKRMAKRAADRWESNYTFFTGGLTEEEQRHRDYFETDQEAQPDNEALEELIDVQEQMQSGEYRLQRFDFQEMYTHAPEDDQSSFLQKKVFRMKYRHFDTSISEHYAREQKMLNASLSRYEKEGRPLQEALWTALAEGKDSSAALAAWTNYQAQEGVRQYQDYYPEDQDSAALSQLASLNSQLAQELFQNVTLKQADHKEMFKIPKRQWNQSFGLWQNFVYEFKDLQEHVLPKTQQISDEAYAQRFRPVSREELDQLKKLEIQGK